MIAQLKSYFKDSKLARMSDGTLCLVRDLGLVKGGKGMRHHETLVTFSVRGLMPSIWTFGAAWPALRATRRQSRFAPLPSALESFYDASGEFR